MTPTHVDMGTGKDVVRYLGNWARFDGLGRDNLTKRLTAAREGYYAMGAFWRDDSVDVFFVVFYTEHACTKWRWREWNQSPPLRRMNEFSKRDS